MVDHASNPFSVCEDFAKQFILSCRKLLVSSLIEKGTETMRDREWRYLGKGVVEYTFTETVHHPAGYHMVGSIGPVDFAAFSDWDEDVRTTSRWNVVTDTREDREPASESMRAFASVMIPFMDLVFADHPVSYAWLMSEVMPKWTLVKKYF